MAKVFSRPQGFNRAQRIAQEIQKEISMILRRDVQNSRIGNVSLSGVEVSRDLACAKIFVTFFEEKGDSQRVQQGMNGLQQAAGFIRSRLGQAMQLRIVPTLHFYHDQSLANGLHIAHLLRQVVTPSAESLQSASADESVLPEDLARLGDSQTEMKGKDW